MAPGPTGATTFDAQLTGRPCPSRPWSPARISWSASALSRPAPFPLPLFRPLEANPGMGLLPPGINMDRPKIFSKNHFRKNTPRVMGPGHQHFIYGRLAGPYCRRFKHFTAPLGLPMDAPFCGPWRGCGGPQRRRFILPGGGHWSWEEDYESHNHPKVREVIESFIIIDRPVRSAGRDILGHPLFPVFGDYCQVDLFCLTYPEEDKTRLLKFRSKSEFIGGF